MTKTEYSKCVKLMEKAIRKAKQSQSEYEKFNDYLSDGDELADIEQRKADQHYGEAVGIEHALATLGFKHDRMKKLSNLL